MKAELRGDVIVLKAPTNAATIVRQIPGARHDAKTQTWLLPLSWATCVTARGVLGTTLEVGPKLSEWARLERAGRITPALELREATALPPTSPWVSVLEEVESEEYEPVPAPAAFAPVPGPGAPQPVPAPPRDAPAAFTDLDDSDAWWWSMWRGMPEFVHSDLSPWKSIKVNFADRAGLEHFAKVIGQTVTDRTRSIWHPQADIGHMVNKRYADETETA